MKHPLVLLGLAALGALAGGCAGGYVEADGPVPVYGEFGYDEPWDYGAPWYAEGVAISRPPYRRESREDDHSASRPPESGRGHPAPAHSAPAGRSIPSIPSASRPSGGGASHSGGGSRSGGESRGGGHAGEGDKKRP